MKYLAYIVFALCLSNASHACSPIIRGGIHYPTPFRELDTMFEGEIWAVYINGGLVSTYAYKNELENIYDSADVLLKIKPTEIYFGDKRNFYEISFKHTKIGNLCGEYEYEEDRGKNVWGLERNKQGSYFRSYYLSHAASYMRKSIITYKAAIEGYLAHEETLQKPANSITQEQSDIAEFLSGNFENANYHFQRTQRELQSFPTELLNARHELMLDLGLREQALQTSVVILNTP